MTQWDGMERRKQAVDLDQMKQDVSDTRSDIRLLFNKIDMNHESLRRSIVKQDEIIEKMNKTVYGNGVIGLTTRVTEIGVLRSEFEKYIAGQRWMIGLNFTLLIGIILKLVWPH